MRFKNHWVITLALFTTAFSVVSLAQTSTVKGALGGVVADASGAVIPGATVTLTGPEGTATTSTDNGGRFAFEALTPGNYSVKVEKENFQTINVPAVDILTGRTAQLTLKLVPGQVKTIVEVNAGATTIDTHSTAVGANLSDDFYQLVPIQRNVASLFQTAPGVVTGGGTGTANPSISGGSGLENQYIADGVNITDSAFGGLGVFTRNQGAIGSGINLSFIKEVDVKTGGFEPQYGQATGGIVQIITKSGSDHFRGALSIYAAPDFARAAELQRDAVRVNPVGERLGQSSFEASGELGGYIPGLRNHLFFFGSADPTRNNSFWQPARGSGLLAIDPFLPQHFTTYNYSGKLTLKVNDSHSFDASIFGDPSRTNTSALTTSFNAQNETGFSSWRYGTRNMVGRYNGTLSPTWLLDASVAYNTNYFHEQPASDVFQIVDRTTPVITTLQGFGFLEQHNSHQLGYTLDTSKAVSFLGTQTFSIGYHQEHPHYTNIQNRSGGTFAIPSTNYQGGSYLPPSPVPLAGQPTDSQFSLKNVPGDNLAAQQAACPICPLRNGQPVFLSQSRGQFGGSGSLPTFATYQDAYFNDAWTINKYVTSELGIRWEQQHIGGTLTQYTFTDNWSPRVGVSVDPTGDRKTKLYANFGRYSYDLPLDAAIRALSGEDDLLGEAFAPVLNGNTVTVVPDAAHTLNGTGPFNPPAISIASISENFIPGTKMTYENEFVVGAEHEWNGIVFSARYIDRRLQRIIEDASGTSPEGSQILLQNFSIVNPSPSLDAWVNENQVVIPAGTAVSAFPAGCSASNTLGVSGGVAGPSSDVNGNVFSPDSVCFASPGPGLTGGDYGADGKPDGFAKPVRNYTAFEFEANKSFSHNYMMRVNYRRAKLNGNYEGAFRNDNGQTDPGISSLFDFVPGNFNLLGDQFAIGPLNTDRRNVVNTFFSYTADRSALRGLTLGTSIRVQSGTPISEFANHPAYGNAGEVPLGGRGKLGRTPVSGQVDLKGDYPIKLSENTALRFGVDLFNIADARPIFLVDQNRDLSFKTTGSNQDFLKPLQYQLPFSARFSARFEF